MGWRVEYRNFHLEEYELTEEGYNRLKTQLASGKILLGSIIPKESFYENEKSRIHRTAIISAIAVAVLIVNLILGNYDSALPYFLMIMTAAGALGGFGVLFSFISYSAYTSKRESYLFKMKRDLLKSVSYDEYCRIRKLN